MQCSQIQLNINILHGARAYPGGGQQRLSGSQHSPKAYTAVTNPPAQRGDYVLISQWKLNLISSSLSLKSIK